MKNKLIYLSGIFLVSIRLSHSQIPVELFTGTEKTTMDIMFFRYFSNKEKHASPVLFFSRTRVSVDNHMSENNLLPQFGFTHALSYNSQKLHGLAPVLVGQIFNRGFFLKTGLQYVTIKKDFTAFGWIVREITGEKTWDAFLLLRLTPDLSEKLKWYSQVELLGIFPEGNFEQRQFIERLRLGLSMGTWQAGVGVDWIQRPGQPGGEESNPGIFIRYQF